ncbi:hypothetical protein [Streptomyces sp. NPDC003710]
MAGRFGNDEPEERGRDWFRVRRPSSTQAQLFSLSVVVTADLGGVIHDRPVAAVAVGVAAVGALVKVCVRRGE